ncbi:MAG: EF-Tu/IF-2/RF-3 family GTPase [Candidatus Hodarchaeota archaeon]
MNHFLISFVTQHHDTIAKKIGECFGKKGQESDLTFYDGLDGEENIFITVTPSGYPDKLKSLLQCLAIGDVHVLLITPDDNFDALLGEMIVALDVYPSAIPMIIIAGINSMNEYKVDEVKEKVKKIVNSTSLKEKIDDIMVLSNYNGDFMVFKEIIIKKCDKLVRRKDNVKILIDAAFPVKGIGTVVLGIVKKGEFNAGAMLELTDPMNPPKNIIAKSIQMQDIDQKRAEAGDRVGLAIKGIKPEEITRENMLVTKNSMKPFSQLKIHLHLSKFSKREIDVAMKQDYHLAIDHQVFPVKPVKVKGTKNKDVLLPGETGIVTFKSDKNFWLDPGENVAIITILEKFASNLRILGSGTVILD